MRVPMKSVVLALLFLIAATGVTTAQTKTTEELDADVDGLSLYFYKNTLRMLNQDDNKEFDEMIKDIEKMRFLLIDRMEENFGNDEFTDLKARYLKEKYEEIMSSRLDGRNFEVYVRESNGDVKGTVILASDSSQLFVLDILGKVAMDKIPAFFKSLDENSDIGKKVKDFMNIDVH
jgi:hypothetical protein